MWLQLHLYMWRETSFTCTFALQSANQRARESWTRQGTPISPAWHKETPLRKLKARTKQEQSKDKSDFLQQCKYWGIYPNFCPWASPYLSGHNSRNPAWFEQDHQPSYCRECSSTLQQTFLGCMGPIMRPSLAPHCCHAVPWGWVSCGQVCSHVGHAAHTDSTLMCISRQCTAHAWGMLLHGMHSQGMLAFEACLHMGCTLRYIHMWGAQLTRRACCWLTDRCAAPWDCDSSGLLSNSVLPSGYAHPVKMKNSHLTV